MRYNGYMSLDKKSRIIIVHGWKSSPKVGWIGWLTRQLKEQGYDVVAPALPNPRQPDLAQWQKVLLQKVGNSKSLILVGHSLGTYTLLELVNVLPRDIVIEKLILVAGFTLSKENTWMPAHYLTDNDLAFIKKRVKKAYMIYSNSDHTVKPAQSRAAAKAIGAKTIQMPMMGHFLNIFHKKLPVVLELITDDAS